VALDGLYDDDGVIDDEADGEYQAKKEKSVLMEKPNRGKKINVPTRENRHSKERNESGAPALEKDVDDDG